MGDVYTLEKRSKDVTAVGNWTCLPFELLQKIAGRLLFGAVEEYICFRAVCVSWRSATRNLCHHNAPPTIPWLLLSFDEDFSTVRTFYRPSDHKTFNFHLSETLNTRILGSTDGWLVLIHKSPTVQLLNPLIMAQVVLPLLTTLPWFVDYQEHNFLWEYTFDRLLYAHSHKEASEIVKSLYAYHVKTFSKHSHDKHGTLVAMSYASRFKVFRMDNLSEVPILTKVNSLGEFALFMDANQSVAFDVKNYPGLRGNCIYFTATNFGENFYRYASEEDRQEDVDGRQGMFSGSDLDVFNLEDGSVEPLANYDNSRFVWPPPIWFIPNIKT